MNHELIVRFEMLAVSFLAFFLLFLFGLYQQRKERKKKDDSSTNTKS